MTALRCAPRPGCARGSKLPSVLLEALAEVELSGYERRCLTWVAACETHMVATVAALITRAHEAGRETNCNHNCNQDDRAQAS